MAKSGPKDAKEGIVEDVKGKGKEVWGKVTGDESKEREGRAQQDRAEAEREAAKHEGKAEAQRAKARADEARQGFEERT